LVPLILLALLAPFSSILYTGTTTIVHASFTGQVVLHPYGVSNVTGNFTIPATDYLTINFTGVNLTGVGDIYIWLSTNNETTITPGDAWYIGPINATLIGYTTISEKHVDFSKTFKLNLGIYDRNMYIGENTTSILAPLYVMPNQSYYIKITDVPPSERQSINSSNVIVSSNSFKIEPRTANIYYEEYNTIWHYAVTGDTVSFIAAPIPANETYTLYINYTFYNYTTGQLVKSNIFNAGNHTSKLHIIPGTDYNPPWTWEGINTTIPLPFANCSVYSPYVIKMQSYYENATLNTTIQPSSYYYLRQIDYISPYVEIYSPLIGSYDYPLEGTVLSTPSKPLYTGSRLWIEAEDFHKTGYLIISLNDTWQLANVTLWYGESFSPYNNSTWIDVYIPDDLTPGYYNLTFRNGDIVAWYLLYVAKSPALTYAPRTLSPGEILTINITNLANYTNYMFSVMATIPDQGYKYWPIAVSTTNSTLLKNFIVKNDTETLKIIIPPLPSGYHTFWLTNNGENETNIIHPSSFVVKIVPSITILPPIISSATGIMTVLCQGLKPNTNYTLIVDHSVIFTHIRPGPNYMINYTIPSTGYEGGIHTFALYEDNNQGYPAKLVAIRIIGGGITQELNLTSQLAPLLTLINNTLANTELIQTLIYDLGANLTLKLLSMNNSLATLMISGLNGISDLQSSVLTILTNLTDLNASIIDIKGDTAIIQTILGNATASLSLLNQSIINVTNLLINNKGDIIATIQTLSGNLTADLNIVEELVNKALINQTVLSNLLLNLSSLLNNTFLGVNQLKTLLGQLNNNITSSVTSKIVSVNQSLATLILQVDARDERVHIQILSKLDDLDASVAKVIKTTNNINNSLNTLSIVLNTKIGEIQTSLKTLIEGNAMLKTLIINSKGEIEGVITTKAGNITANIKTVEELVKAGLPVDTGTIAKSIENLVKILDKLSTNITSVSSSISSGNNNIVARLNSMDKSLTIINNTIDLLQGIILENLAKVNQTIINKLSASTEKILEAISNTNTSITSTMGKELKSIMNLQKSLGEKITGANNNTNSLGISLKSYIDAKTGEIKEESNKLYSSAMTLQYVTMAMVALAIIFAGLGGFRKK